MKKILLTMMAIMAILPASADNYFSLRTDSVWAVNNAADINQDGAVTIGDITDIIELITS